jgi:hypothetical protein
MSTIKIFQKLRKCLSKQLILMLGIIVLGGVRVILHINNKNMIEHVSFSREQFK